MILVGLDDTDIPDSPGTNQLCLQLVDKLADIVHTVRILRHQLLYDERIPFTTQNGSASLLLEPRGELTTAQLAARLRPEILAFSPPGSDPGLCIAWEIPNAVRQFGRACQTCIVTQAEAFALAESNQLLLEPLGGTGGGIIGALAAVGLAADENDGRVIYTDRERRPRLEAGWHSCETILANGVQQIRCLQTGEGVDAGLVQIEKKLRPNLVAGRIVLHVEPAVEDGLPQPAWRAVKCL